MPISLQKGYTMAKPDTTGKTPTENDAENGAVEQLRPWQRMQKKLAGIAKLDSENGGGFDIAQGVIDKMLTVSAEDNDAFIDAVLNAGSDGPLKAEDMEHKPFMVKEITVYKSSESFAKGGFGTYLVVKAISPISLEEITFSVGATNVVGALFAFNERGIFESDSNPTLVIRSRPTPNGNLFFLVRA